MADGYVALTLGGVQEFIAASRRTADLWVASRLMSQLCRAAVRSLESTAGAEALVFPRADDVDGALPNRVFAVLPAGLAEEGAAKAGADVREEWARLSAVCHGAADSATRNSLRTFPQVRWVVWTAADADYARGWEIVGGASAARKRVRNFAPYTGAGGELCSLCGQRDGFAWAGRPGVRVASGERLCAVCAVKRDRRVAANLLGERAVFPSTASVATAPFRVRLVGVAAADPAVVKKIESHAKAVTGVSAALRALGSQDNADQKPRGGLPAVEEIADRTGSDLLSGWVRLDGAWSLPDTWQVESLLHENRLPPSLGDARRASLEAACRAGRDASAALAQTDDFARLREPLEPLAPQGSTRPARYLSLLVQDADDMGDHLSRFPPAADPTGMRSWHAQVSSVLTLIAAEQDDAIRRLLGRVVYAGGDDLLALVPAAAALEAAWAGRSLFLDRAGAQLDRPTVSSAVVFFHCSYPLQEALARAREALHAAKSRDGKDSLSVVVLRRGGERAAATVAWTRAGAEGSSATAALTGLVGAFRDGLSPGLLADLVAVRHGLADLARAGMDYRAELRRVVGRHVSGSAASRTADIVRLILELEPAHRASVSPADVVTWAQTLEVARFIAQETR